MWKIFEGKAKKYDEWYDKNREIFEKEVKCIKSLIEGKKIVEIGVGTGRFAEKLKVEIGLDASLDMLKIAKKKLEVIRGDAHNLPFKNSTFDCTLFVVTLCFLNNPIEALKEAHRILKANGCLIAAIVPANSELGKKYIEKARQGHEFYSKAKFYTIREIEEMLEKAGFKVVDRKSIGVVSVSDFVCIKALKVE